MNLNVIQTKPRLLMAERDLPNGKRERITTTEAPKTIKACGCSFPRWRHIHVREVLPR